MGESKAQVRSHIRKRRAAYSLQYPQEKSVAEGLICEQLVALIQSVGANTVALYKSLNEEPCIEGVTTLIAKASIADWVYPVVKDQNLEWVADWGQWKRHQLGMLEPVGQPVEPESLDLVVVPGVAFDLDGFRLGMGKGFYDRALARLNAIKVGVCFSGQCLDQVPRDAWDVPMDYVVTEKFVLGKFLRPSP